MCVLRITFGKAQQKGPKFFRGWVNTVNTVEHRSSANNAFEFRWGHHMRREFALEWSPHSVVGLEKYVVAERPLRCRANARRGNVRVKFSVVHHVLDRNAV